MDRYMRAAPSSGLSMPCTLQFEAMRTLSHCASELNQKNVRSSSKVLSDTLADELSSMPLDEAIPLTRACGEPFYLCSTLRSTQGRVITTGASGLVLKCAGCVQDTT